MSRTPITCTCIFLGAGWALITNTFCSKKNSLHKCYQIPKLIIHLRGLELTFFSRCWNGLIISNCLRASVHCGQRLCMRRLIQSNLGLRLSSFSNGARSEFTVAYKTKRETLKPQITNITLFISLHTTGALGSLFYSLNSYTLPFFGTNITTLYSLLPQIVPID